MADDDVLDQEYDPASEPSSSQQWLNLIADHEKKFRDWQDRADRIDEIYANLNEQASNVRPRQFAMFWANIQVLAPSVYARKPIPVVVPEFKDRDQVKLTTSEMLERALSKSFDLDDLDGTMRLVRDDMLVVGRGVLWVRYEDKGEVRDDKGTQTTVERVRIEFLDRKDFAHEPARNWKEIGWVGRRAWLTRKEMRARFASTSGDAWMQAAYQVPTSGRAARPEEGSSPEEKCGVWEIWHRGLDKVAWITEGVDVPLDIGPPHLRLEGFFPCPKPAYSTVQRETLIPVPDFVYYRDQLEEIDKLTARIHALSDAVQVKGFYPGGGEIGEAVEAALNLNDDRKVMVPVSNFAAFGTGGDPIVWMPIDLIATTIAGLIEMRRQIIDDVYQIVGLSDIMRGSSEPEETLGAQQLKSQYGSVRIRDKQFELVRVAREATRIAGEIMAEEFSRETLLALSQMRLPTDAEIAGQVRDIKRQVAQGAQQVQQQMLMLQMQAVQAQLQAPEQGPQPSVPPEGPQATGGSSPGQGPPGGPPEGPEGPQEDQGPDPEEEMERLQQQAQEALQQASQQMSDLEAETTVEDVMNLLRNERLRPFALDIETDSTIQPDEDAEKQRRAEFLQVFGGLMQQLAALVEARPEAAAFAGEVLKFGLAPYRIGRDLDGAIDEFVQRLEASAQGEKPPSPEQIKAQAEAQKLMADQAMKVEELKAKSLMEERKMQYEWQMQRAEVEIKQQEMMMEDQRKTKELQAKLVEMGEKHRLEMQKMQMELVKMQKETEATDAKIAAQREDQTLRRQAHEQDFSFKERESSHRMGLMERQASLKNAFNGAEGG